MPKRAKLRYELRPAKHIERHMIAEACRRLKEIAPLSRYEYVGFGGLEFLDFDLFHRALGIKRMTSIEHDDEFPKRFEFNKPFKGVTVLMGTSSQHLPELDWEGLRIVWLDFEKPLVRDAIRDAEHVIRVMQPGSVLIVTVSAASTVGKRREQLATRIGEERIPQGIQENDLNRWGYAGAQRQVLLEALNVVCAARADRVHLRQVFNFVYSDGGRMQTVGWILSSDAVDQAVDRCGLHEFEFIRVDDTVMEIRVPILTRREIAYLNQRLPTSGRRTNVGWMDRQDQDDYASLYRWYPSPRAPITSP